MVLRGLNAGVGGCGVSVCYVDPLLIQNPHHTPSLNPLTPSPYYDRIRRNAMNYGERNARLLPSYTESVTVDLGTCKVCIIKVTRNIKAYVFAVVDSVERDEAAIIPLLKKQHCQT